MLRYLVIALRTPEFTASVIDPHLTFLDQLRLQGKLDMTGPFTDKSGGAYILRASNMEEARALAFSDPLHTTESSTLTIYEWDAS